MNFVNRYLRAEGLDGVVHGVILDPAADYLTPHGWECYIATGPFGRVWMDPRAGCTVSTQRAIRIQRERDAAAIFDRDRGIL